MSSIPSLLLKHLDELVQDDLDRFKLSLTRNMAQGFDPIPRSKLENAKHHNVVDLLVDQYGPSNAAKITVQILNQIGQKKLANDLEKKLEGKGAGGPVQAAEVHGASSSSSSSQAGEVSQNISAEGPSNIHAPVLSGGNYYSPVTMNFTSTQK
ncbi:hypothetical protein PDJAM_G00162590 [Pangasius djambal]|uniref:Uncharacterized protein n=1 Tax=Pangasius djambal TaxID=1691987 RepID=A0ACC5ZL53_9TELE|nr:hypothetical protein [Pangasius djambal]